MSDDLTAKTIRQNSADLELIASIKKDSGLTQDSEIYRAGLRSMRRELDVIPVALNIIAKNKKSSRKASTDR